MQNNYAKFHIYYAKFHNHFTTKTPQKSCTIVAKNRTIFTFLSIFSQERAFFCAYCTDVLPQFCLLCFFRFVILLWSFFIKAKSSRHRKQIFRCREFFNDFLFRDHGDFGKSIVLQQSNRLGVYPFTGDHNGYCRRAAHSGRCRNTAFAFLYCHHFPRSKNSLPG